MAVALACAASELAWRFPGTASNPGNPLFHLMGNSSAHGTFKQGEAGKIPYLLERFRPCVLARGAYIALGQNAPSRINILCSLSFPALRNSVNAKLAIDPVWTLPVCIQHITAASIIPHGTRFNGISLNRVVSIVWIPDLQAQTIDCFCIRRRLVQTGRYFHSFSCRASLGKHLLNCLCSSLERCANRAAMSAPDVALIGRDCIGASYGNDGEHNHEFKQAHALYIVLTPHAFYPYQSGRAATERQLRPSFGCPLSMINCCHACAFIVEPNPRVVIKAIIFSSEGTGDQTSTRH